MIGIADTTLSENEIDAAVQVLRSGNLRQGKESDAFEEEFADKVGARHAVSCANGSAALHLAYLSCLEPGDEVLVPSFTFIATGSMAAVMGARPIFCDIDPDTFLLDLDHAESCITERTRAIAPVHLFGNPLDVKAVRKFADKHDLKIIWDAAQSHGAQFEGADIGGLGDFVCYSFYPSKNMFVGEGGMICTDSTESDDKMRYLRTHGQTGKYYHTSLGFNYRLTDVEAAIGRQQLTRLDDMLIARRRNAAILNQGLESVDGIEPQAQTPGGEHAWHQFCVVVDAERFGCDRDVLGERLREKGVMNGVHYPRGLHQQPIFEEMYGRPSLPVTETVATRILAIPVHHGLTETEARAVVDTIRELAG